MIEATAGMVEQTAEGEEQLWQAVITKTIEEWLHGSGRRKLDAEHYLFNDQRDFPAVCLSAGMNAEYLRVRLLKLRAQAARQDCAIAA
jgi:hypothetical protein